MKKMVIAAVMAVSLVFAGSALSATPIQSLTSLQKHVANSSVNVHLKTKLSGQLADAKAYLHKQHVGLACGSLADFETTVKQYAGTHHLSIDQAKNWVVAVDSIESDLGC